MSLIDIGVSGINAAQAWLNVTGQNIANASNPNYCREGVELASLGGIPGQGGGVQVIRYSRYSDPFLSREVCNQSAQLNQFTTRHQYLSQIDTVLGADSNSISKGMDDLFASFTAAQKDPQDLAYRQQILSQSGELVNRFHMMDDRLEKLRSESHDQLTSSVTKVNSVLGNIAKLNQQIADGQAGGSNVSDLLDQRNGALKSLSQYMDIQSSTASDGSINLYMKNGEPLLLGNQPGQLKLEEHGDGSYDLALTSAGTTTRIHDGIGSSIGALFDYNAQDLNRLQQQLDSMASEVANSFNQVQATGEDLEGKAGQPLFSFDPDHPAKSLKLAIDDPSELAFSAPGKGPGDNSNLNQFLDLQNQKISGLGGVTFSDYYSQMVSQVANDTATAKDNMASGQSLLKVAVSNEQAVAGVSQDEEAANLMRYTQAYQANAKVISTARDMFSTLLSTFS
ncbi:flagellar hook-associated protein FlgK [Dongshaea marina]|uniref:flagellar hook-associated protein FlgK n=1 Tax=Dongshaea marina TaxID=2047966 RepID=UPI000D3E1E90|nr:flagellar hook-associated protein FlgK [Dongshaea marina]